ncbi:MAG: universal stress protein [Aeoliella sp.]
MKRFQRILVGVDLSWGDRFVAEELSAPNAEAVSQALWLAKLNSATIDFLFSLDLSAKAQELIHESSTDESTILDEAEKRLAELVVEAQEQGVVAKSHVVIGRSWVELIHQVFRKQHDLVLVGTRHMSAIQGHLIGSTGTKLLRNCPCAVWVTQPQVGEEFDSILVAHDLRPVGDLAMELGCSMARLQHAELHVIHAADFPESNYMFPASVSAERQREYRLQAEQHIERQLAGTELTSTTQVQIEIEPADVAIMKCLEREKVDLIVMGTVGRTGISGFITGNTAERLLPRIQCSLLAVKPPGFKSPVQPDED